MRRPSTKKRMAVFSSTPTAPVPNVVRATIWPRRVRALILLPDAHLERPGEILAQPGFFERRANEEWISRARNEKPHNRSLGPSECREVTKCRAGGDVVRSNRGEASVINCCACPIRPSYTLTVIGFTRSPSGFRASNAGGREPAAEGFLPERQSIPVGTRLASCARIPSRKRCPFEPGAGGQYFPCHGAAPHQFTPRDFHAGSPGG